MNIKEANEKLKVIAGNKASCISIEVMNYNHDNTSKIKCKAYVADAGWTSEHATFEDALFTVAQMVNGIEHPERLVSMLESDDAFLAEVEK